VLLGSSGQLTVLKMASCQLGGYFCIFLKSTKVKRMLIYLARVEWLWMASSFAHLVAVAGSLSGQILVSSCLLVWRSFLTAFGVEKVQPFSPVGAKGLKQLIVAV